jgi:hypothetical protein
VRVAARLVRDGDADAFVSAGSTGATVAAALFTIGRVRGMARIALAVVVPAADAPVILLDAGASPEVTVEGLTQHAVAGSAYARVRLGLDAPRVGLLSIGEEAGKGDDVRKRAYEELSRLDDIDFVGNVEGGDVATGGRADVVVTDGFTGNVLLKGMEGAIAMATAALASAIGADPALRQAATLLRPAFEHAAGSIDPDRHGGAVLPRRRRCDRRRATGASSATSIQGRASPWPADACGPARWRRCGRDRPLGGAQPPRPRCRLAAQVMIDRPGRVAGGPGGRTGRCAGEVTVSEQATDRSAPGGDHRRHAERPCAAAARR